MKFKAEFLNSTTTITEYQARTYSIGSMVSLLNRKGFRLGNGHDGSDMYWINENEAVLTLVPYIGAPTQTIRFELM